MSTSWHPVHALVQSWRGLHMLMHTWWRLLLTSAALLVLALTPSSYRAPYREHVTLRLYTQTAPLLLGFALVTAVLAVVLTHIVVVTARSYGLSHLALQVVIRVLVLELIPLTAAIAIAVRCTIPDGSDLAKMLEGAPTLGLHNLPWMRLAVLPRVAAGVFAGCLLAAMASVLSLIVAYWVSYGFTLSGLAGFIRSFGQVFTPAVCLILALKIILLCLTVTLIPVASTLNDAQQSPTARSEAMRSSAEMRSLVRMAALVLLVEVASLVGNYA